jgi:dipeptidyl aminopeptidase/acylaminoacyl peptidase
MLGAMLLTLASVEASALETDGEIVNRQELVTISGTRLDIVAYRSEDLIVAGLLCYPDDGNPHPTLIHVHGGFGGIFDGTNPGSLQLCFDMASRHGLTTFMPSLRGRDGSQGIPQLCGGEAQDVAAAAILVRSLEVSDPEKVALMGGSIGGCVALKASGLIPNLSAVVAFVPPTDWKEVVSYHRTNYSPATETLCDGSELSWTLGGPPLADNIELGLCGHVNCSDEDFAARSPLPALLAQSAPTMIVSAGADNIVPPNQQLLWSILRQQNGFPVALDVVAPCDPPALPAATSDVHLHVNGGFHLLSRGAISSGFLFVFNHLGL